VRVAGRELAFGCAITIDARLPLREGAPVRPLVPRLGFISNKESWGHSLRAGPIMLTPSDFGVMKAALLNAVDRRAAS